MHKFIDDCKANDIKLVMCYSPYYGQTIPKSIMFIEELANMNDVTFWNYGDIESFQKSEYFQDASHLNNTGANAFTKEIACFIKHNNIFECNN